MLFQQNNTSLHGARVSQYGLQVIQQRLWPAWSPDLSPIKYIWNMMGQRLPRSVSPPTTLDGIIYTILILLIDLYMCLFTVTCLYIWTFHLKWIKTHMLQLNFHLYININLVLIGHYLYNFLFGFFFPSLGTNVPQSDRKTPPGSDKQLLSRT